MNRIDAMREIGSFVRRYQSVFATLPRDAEGKPANIEIRKHLAIDPEMTIALAALLALLYVVIESEMRAEANRVLSGRQS